MRPHGALEKDTAKVCNKNMFFCGKASDSRQHSLLVFAVKQVVSHSVEQKLESIRVCNWAETVCWVTKFVDYKTKQSLLSLCFFFSFKTFLFRMSSADLFGLFSQMEGVLKQEPAKIQREYQDPERDEGALRSLTSAPATEWTVEREPQLHGWWTHLLSIRLLRNTWNEPLTLKYVISGTAKIFESICKFVGNFLCVIWDSFSFFY